MDFLNELTPEKKERFRDSSLESREQRAESRPWETRGAEEGEREDHSMC